MSEDFDIKQAIRKVVDGDDLTFDEAGKAMDQIMLGEATPAQIASLLTAMRVRGETVDEIAGFAHAMRGHARQVQLPADVIAVDTCGTGGDHSGTFNISTTAAFVIAGSGVNVAKHGNRSVTSACGSADLLEALGVAIELEPDHVAAVIDEAGIGFMFAPAYHPGFRHAGPVRREIGIRTVFNLLGPMVNPANVKRQLIGVGDGSVSARLAAAQDRLGAERVLFVHSSEGFDEFGLGGPSAVTEFDRERGVRSYEIDAVDFGLGRAPAEAVMGGDANRNVEITSSVLNGQPGPYRDVVVLNAGAGLYAAGRAESIADGIAIANATLDSGAALAALEAMIAASNRKFVREVV
ncbi:MAG: anthranilate phosphoribosyltransferase [Thermomicrobiales bacterium]|nr:anthranilate phosphoribosyltransferase [Thermomicrobiales bacterium]